MYAIIKEEYGFRLTFANPISRDEMLQFRVEAVRSLVGIRGEIGLVIDLRNFQGEALEPEAREEMADGIELFRRAGVRRSCIILSSVSTTAQYRRRQRQSRPKFNERYINAETTPLWSLKASKWIKEGVEPGE